MCLLTVSRAPLCCSERSWTFVSGTQVSAAIHLKNGRNMSRPPRHGTLLLRGLRHAVRVRLRARFFLVAAGRGCR